MTTERGKEPVVHTWLLRFAIAVLFLVGTNLLTPIQAAYAFGGTQVLPYTGGSPNFFSYQDAYLTTPNPPLGNGQWAAGPNGVSNLTNTFIESGPIKDCTSGSCVYHPYASWQGPGTSGFLETPDNLAPGGSYRYKAYNIGSNNWQAVWCSGLGCSGIATANLGSNSLPYVGSGAEAMPYGVHFGSITTTSNYALKNGSYQYWCYTSISDNVGGGHTSACNTSNHSWTVTY